ncbi:hypothetical protein SISSUDRAFT_1124611 [Sistotremastrum suecicum HHB10207 ss-3]|uniref:DUF7918 domain-containing protein n=1 Tax=Sistotremastrum suecicum HHB10207 ss-3 TaxID=1314776 RepID=A0A166I6X8_9AGAM|nr:hypothetical protein SISSUDRAFT_1124611 [Sistotremastrum suecicum HHB10207 ss-3]
MPKINGYEAWVEIDGERLDEFQLEVDEDQDDNELEDDGSTKLITRLSCYIPSEAGKVFRICATIQRVPTSFSVIALVTVDGKSLSDADFSVDEKHPEEPGRISFEEYRVDSKHKTKLMFDNITLTDDDTAAEKDHGRLAHLGTICVEIEPGIWVKRKRPRGPPKTTRLKKFSPVHEQHKIGGSHCLQIADLILDPVKLREEGVRYDSWEWKRLERKRMYEFTFKYGPLDWLQAKGYAPLIKRLPDAPPSPPMIIEESPRIEPLELSPVEPPRIEPSDITMAEPQPENTESSNRMGVDSIKVEPIDIKIKKEEFPEFKPIPVKKEESPEIEFIGIKTETRADVKPLLASQVDEDAGTLLDSKDALAFKLLREKMEAERRRQSRIVKPEPLVIGPLIAGQTIDLTLDDD